MTEHNHPEAAAPARLPGVRIVRQRDPVDDAIDNALDIAAELHLAFKTYSSGDDPSRADVYGPFLQAAEAAYARALAGE